MLRIGIDEAGLGPTLGPLVVAGAAFRFDGATVGHNDRRGDTDVGAAVPFDTDLGRVLSAALAAPGRRRSSGAGARLVVGDSKAIYGPAHDLSALEIPVLAFIACRAGGDGRWPATLDELLLAVGGDPAERTALPWYAAPAPPTPLVADVAVVEQAATRLRDALAAAGVEFVGFRADVIPESRLNRDFETQPNKADVLFARSADAFDRLSALRRPGEAVGAVMDRQGGRRFYLPPMMARWPQRFTWPLEETPTCSRYRVKLDDAEAEVRFVVGGDAEAPETGLASMLAKYLREAFMSMWNRYFEGVCPGVPRTAGYALDARRWLGASRGARLAAGIDDAQLVRTR
ncbi:MAG: hypothetical protein K8T90_08185 [Planctomycetes bacterium]|nr:hypothetical protein [Planctomycetota bacterium]